jgi:hypothetical protein
MEVKIVNRSKKNLKNDDIQTISKLTFSVGAEYTPYLETFLSFGLLCLLPLL